MAFFYYLPSSLDRKALDNKYSMLHYIATQWKKLHYCTTVMPLLNLVKLVMLLLLVS